MTEMSFELDGLMELAEGLEERGKLEAVKNIVKTNGAQLNANAIRNAKFRGHYRNGKFIKPTGQTRRSIATTLHDQGLTSKTKPSTDYSPYLEHGTRRMSAQPFMGPAFREQKEKFKRQIKDLT